MSWPNTTLRAITGADDLHISPLRDDGVTYGTPTWIWSVVVGESLYARAYNGTSSSWYKAALRQRAGRISSAGRTIEVWFEPVDNDTLQAQIDDAYRAKYHASPYLKPMIGARARAATVRIVPHETRK